MLTPRSVLSNQVGVMWAYTLRDAALPDILVLQVQQFAWSGYPQCLKGLATMTLLCKKEKRKCCLTNFIAASHRELSMEVMHQSSESNFIWCARSKTLPSPSVLYGLRPHKTLKKSDLKNNLILQPKLITHGLLTVDALKSREWGISYCCWRLFFFVCDHM